MTEPTCCVVASVLEERYERLDDGSQLEYAHLKKAWQLSWSREDGVSTVLPYDEGIHRVGNPGGETAISVHLYGPKIGDLDGRDYDAFRDHVFGQRQPEGHARRQPRHQADDGAYDAPGPERNPHQAERVRRRRPGRHLGERRPVRGQHTAEHRALDGPADAHRRHHDPVTVARNGCP